MADNPSTPAWQDVQGVVGRDLTTAERAQATHWIALAKATIRGRLGDLDKLSQEDLSLVVTEVVAGKVHRPGGETQVSVQSDGTVVSRSWRGEDEIKPEWWALLAPDNSGMTSLAPRP